MYKQPAESLYVDVSRRLQYFPILEYWLDDEQNILWSARLGNEIDAEATPIQI
jgi:hypothetical protein